MIRPQKGKNVLFCEAKLKTAQFSCKQTKTFYFWCEKAKKILTTQQEGKKVVSAYIKLKILQSAANPYSLQKSLKKHHLATKKPLFFEG